jgi:signal transduction histidine kinase
MRFGSLNFRLTSVFAVVFLIFTAAVFGVSLYLISSTLRRKTEMEVEAEFLRFWALYQTYHEELLEQEVFQQAFVEEGLFSLIRVADAENDTLLFAVPDHWEELTEKHVRRAVQPTQGAVTTMTVPDSGQVVEVHTYELHDGKLLQLGIDVTSRTEVLRHFRIIFLAVALPLLVVGYLGGLLVSRNALKPIGTLTDAIRRIIETGNTRRRIEPTGTGDELDELVRLFNTMIGKVDGLIQGMRNTLDNVAHDLRTPMTRFRNRAELSLQAQRSDEEYRETIHELLEESEEILTMLNTLMDISEARTGSMQLGKSTVDLGRLATDMADLYAYSAEEKSITLHAGTEEEVNVDVDVNRIRQVVANLLDNAIKYTDPGGHVDVVVRRETPWAVLSVRDTGIGIDERDIEAIWNRLYRSERSRTRKGLGLGLSLVKAITEAHEGRVAVISALGRGSVFEVRLPLADGVGEGERDSGKITEV